MVLYFRFIDNKYEIIAEPMNYQDKNGVSHTFKCGWGPTKVEAIAHCKERNKEKFKELFKC